MKKNLLVLFILLFCINVEALTGDVDGDNYVKVNDYLLIRKHLLNKPALTGDMLQRADVNGDSVVSTADYVMIRRIIMNSSLPTNTPNQDIKVTGISLQKSVVNLETSDTYKLSYSISPSNATNKTVTWKSSNTSIAKVSSDGVITTNSLFGTTTITATTADGASAEVTVNVTKERIHFINIGEAGNSILLDSYYGGKNHYVLIDAATCKNNVDCGSKRIDKYIGSSIKPVKSDGTLDSNGGVKKIDAVVVSHMHYDHAGYMAKIIEKYKPDKVIIKKYSVSKSYLSGIKSAAKKAGSTIVYPTEGSEYTFGNFKLKIYNTKDVVGSNDYSENINSLIVMASTIMGDKTYLTYLPGDLEYGKNKSNNKVILDVSALSNKIKSDYGLSNSRPVDIYVASHHGYYNDDGSVGIGLKNGVNNIASVIEPLYIKSAVVPNTFGWLCQKTNTSQYNGIKNIYDNLVKNNGDTKIRFSGATRVKAIFRAKGMELTGGEVLSCNKTTCGSVSAIRNAIKKGAPYCKRQNYTK